MVRMSSLSYDTIIIRRNLNVLGTMPDQDTETWEKITEKQREKQRLEKLIKREKEIEEIQRLE